MIICEIARHPSWSLGVAQNYSERILKSHLSSKSALVHINFSLLVYYCLQSTNKNVNCQRKFSFGLRFFSLAARLQIQYISFRTSKSSIFNLVSYLEALVENHSLDLPRCFPFILLINQRKWNKISIYITETNPKCPQK